MTKSILIIGAGELGFSLIHSFLSHPSKPTITVLLRPSSASKNSLSHLPLNIIYGDITSLTPTLISQLQNYDLIISATGFASGSGSQLDLAKAILRAEVKHYIPWQFGVDYDLIGKNSSQPLFDEQLEVRDLLRGQSETKWTIISTGLFTSFLFDPIFGVVNFKKDGKVQVNALGRWEDKLTITSAQEIGILTSKIVLDQPQIPEDVVYISSDTIKFEDVAEESKRVGWNVEKDVITIEELQDRLNNNTDGLGEIAKYQLIWAKNVGTSWELEETYNGKNGIMTKSLGEWVDKNIPKPRVGM